MLRSALGALTWAAATCAVSAASIVAFDLRPIPGAVGYLLEGISGLEEASGAP
jgi:hypothetical protein